MMQSDRQAREGASPLRGDIAIVGMGCLFAGAPDLDTYWRNILSKVDAVSDPPADEWDPKLFYNPDSKTNDRVYCKRGGYIGDLASFRPTDFGIMPVTVDGGEPDQWLALRVAYEALADAGYTEPPKEHVRTEVILGKGTYVNRGNLTVGYHGMIVDYLLEALKNLHPEYTENEIDGIRKELKSNLPPFSADTAPALIGNIIAGRIANRLDLMGPSFTVDAACASALLAIEIGVRDLLSGKCDLVLAGGANVNAPLPTMSLFCQLGALSRKEQIRPFDKNADGTILGEGLGMIVLKRREDAERDGNRIYAIVKGVGLASDGRALHVMAPRVEGEELALRRAYDMAGVEPETVGLIEAHGTATPVGDQVELQALSRVFGGRSALLPNCAIGSVKSMIGHTMPAAGIAGVIKTALALYHRILPPSLNCDEPNPALGLDQTPFYVNTEARPWVHGGEAPRRAGVNSFGFGGINGHVVLEEHPAEDPRERSHQLDWETEICILEAESREKLIERGGVLRAYLAGAGPVLLKDIAYSLNTRLTGEPCRLSIVATSVEDLGRKLSVALGRLADPKTRQIKDNAGVYFFEKPLEGKVAFLFPGEGAQYPNMLLDLCMHFPEVRKCFDLADRALTKASRRILPSEFIYPRSILSKSEVEEVDRALWQIDGAVESVLIGNSAIWTLLRHLEIQPDVILGHSTGDYSAMLASGVIALSEDRYADIIPGWNQAHQRLSTEVEVPEVTLVAVAADSATVLSIAKSIGSDICIAMDNCPHQVVLVGKKDAAERAIEQLRQRAIIYEVLPFDRPYHTPLFQAYADGARREFFSGLPLSAPQVETWSCTTADRYPSDREAIEELFVDHWVKPVLFTQTIQRMYEEGVRVFVEAGPRGNLTAFVSDILRGKPHLAMPANVARRSGITQLHHLIGVLAAQGVGMRLDYLYARRNPKQMAWDDPKPAVTKPKPSAMKLTLALPPLKVAPRERKAPAVVQHAAAVATAAPQNGTHHPLPEIAVHQNVQPLPRNGSAHKVQVPQPIAPVALPPAALRAAAPSSTSPSAQVMQEYLKGMEAFLDVETQVMGAFLNRTRTVAPAPAPVDFPLLGAITSITPGQELTATRQLNLSEDIFLRDHALGGPASITEPDLKPMMVVPLTMSMEILAEAGAALMPGQLLVGMRDVQAFQWIRVDEIPVNLQISAQRKSAGEVSAQVRILPDAAEQRAPRPIIQATVLFGDRYPAPPAPEKTPLAAERTSRLISADLYDGRLMFHGPCFQGVARVERSGPNGVAGQLQILPAGNLFRSISNPRFVTDPVLLDAAGQLVGYWAAEYLERGFVVFPYHVEELRIYGPNRPVGERISCRVDLELKGNDATRADIEMADASGTVWMQLKGWADRRFDPPQRFHKAWTTPREATISESWQTPLAGIRQSGSFECYRLKSLFPPGASLWKELWPSLVLTRNERRTFAQRRGPELRQMEWLSARTAAKDAIRTFLFRHYGLELLPADIEITQDEHGRPIAAGAWTQRLGVVPEVSLAHSEGMAIALVGNGSNGQHFGIDIQTIRELKADFETIAFNAAELRLLDGMAQAMRAEWMFRLWCAKEAVSKALGRGLIEGPASVRILSLNMQNGMVTAAPQGKLAEAAPMAKGRELPAWTVREGALVVATAIYDEKRAS